MQTYIQEYASSKDVAIAEKMAPIAKSRDEISSLAIQFSDMIRQIGDYIEQVISTQNALAREKNNSRLLEEKTLTDALTGLKNRNAYDNADSVFKRADKAMYLNKKAMKAVRTE